MSPFIFNSADDEEEEEEEEEEEVAAAVAATVAAAMFFNMCIVVTCVVFVSIQQRLRGSQENCGRRGEDDSGEEDNSMSTKASTSDDGLSLDDDDDEPPPGEKRAAPVTTKKTTQPFEMSKSSSDVEMANDPLLLLKNAPTPAVKSGDEDSGNVLIRSAPAKGRSKAVLAGKRKSLDDEDEDSDAYIRPVKKTKTTAQTRMTESFEKSPARAKLASKTTTVRKLSGSTKLPPKKVHAKANGTSDDEF
ncbi:hypothetical protein EDB86DRAFT_3086592 [Lactarius hatsudake]|nr:hypothetical protein EDB86DRAFT_3086592 [Lactarius hatsudake]